MLPSGFVCQISPVLAVVSRIIRPEHPTESNPQSARFEEFPEENILAVVVYVSEIVPLHTWILTLFRLTNDFVVIITDSRYDSFHFIHIVISAIRNTNRRSRLLFA